jgi:hypothetical protein
MTCMDIRQLQLEQTDMFTCIDMRDPGPYDLKGLTPNTLIALKMFNTPAKTVVACESCLKWGKD